MAAVRQQYGYSAMASDHTFDTDEDVLPRALRRFMRNRLMDFAGIALLVSVALIGLALATWNVTDPSLSNANRALPQNLLGRPGAIIADELLQILGLATLVLLVVPVSWATKCFDHEPMDGIWSRIVLWITAILLVSTALSSLPALGTWPLAAGFGGVAGDLISTALTSFFALALKGKLAHILVFTLTATAGLWTMIRACGSGSQTVASHMSRMVGLVSRTAVTGASATARAVRAVIGRARFPKFPSLPKRRERPETTPASGDIITRLAPRRGDGRPRRIEPELAPGGKKFADLPDLPDLEDENVSGEDYNIKAPPPAGKAKVAPRSPQRNVKAKKNDFELPPLELLTEPKKIGRNAEISPAILADNAQALEGVLDDFSVKGQIINVKPGPVVTLYELEPAPGIKSSRVISLADDIARSMSAVSARVAVVPGRNAIGIELPNAKRETVYLRELLSSSAFEQSTQGLCLALGKNIGGEPVYADLARMPHLLIAGTTGSGKSVGINTMILSLLYRLPPDRCKLIMIDPKMLELSVYEGIPHLLAPVVTDPRKAVVALKWAVREMEDRYKKMSKIGVRNVDGFNARMHQLLEKGEKLTRTVQTGFDVDTGQPIFETQEQDSKPMPYIVVIIDEMADLMMVAGKDIEGAVQRLAQMARAAGIHVVMATQRPSVDVITGTIKANFPTRVSFQVTSRIDSRTILGEQGAEQLLGQGDMLYMAGGGRISRLHAPFVSDAEVEAIVTHLKSQATPEYVEAVTEEADDDAVADLLAEGGAGGSGDQLYDQAVAVVLRDKKVSTSYIQRRLQIGYNKAASLIERMEKEGLISGSNATGKREILVPGDSAND
jgi:DNA segregation ATPase FtsK/SpoIIIE, S-DNA-T family